MKIQFEKLTLYDSDIIAEFDVAEEPTEEQYKAIEDEIFKVIDKWDEENDADFVHYFIFVCNFKLLCILFITLFVTKISSFSL